MTKPLSASPSGSFSTILNRPYWLLVLTPLFWGGNMVAGKMAVGQIDPYVLIVLRWAGALLVTLPFAIGPLRTDWPVIRRTWPVLFFYGALGYATFNVLMYVAAYFTSAVNSSIEQALIPVLVMLGNFIVFKVRARLLQVLGVILTIIGVGVTATHGDFTRIVSMTVNFGDGMVLLACLSYAIYSLTLRYRPRLHWLSFLSTTCLGALVAGIVFQAIFGTGLAGFFTQLPQVTPLGWLIVLFVATFPSVLAQLFYARGVELIGPNRASLFINLIPVFGTLLSILILSEPIEAYHLATAILVVAGIGLAEWSARKAARPALPAV